MNTQSVSLCQKNEIPLSVTGAASYTWSPQTQINCIHCSDVIVSPDQNTEYCVTGTTDHLCYSTLCVTVELSNSTQRQFSFPTAFTPNGDGINDIFCLQGWEKCNSEFLIRIFDRWGEKVFESNVPDFCWDGIYKGKVLSADDYVFSVTAEYADKVKVNKKGIITLIR
jgi:gliding motility-associated-like protein